MGITWATLAPAKANCLMLRLPCCLRSPRPATMRLGVRPKTDYLVHQQFVSFNVGRIAAASLVPHCAAPLRRRQI